MNPGGGGGGHRQYLFLAQIYQGLKSLGNGLWTLTNWAQHVICVHTCKQGGLMCRIWDWQSTIVKDLNDSQDPKHTLFCREKSLCCNLRAFFKQQMFARRRKGTMWLFFTIFHVRASLRCFIPHTTQRSIHPTYCTTVLHPSDIAFFTNVHKCIWFCF